MKKIIAIIKPFDMQQKLYVYEDTELKDTVETSIAFIEEQIAKCCEKYDVHIVDLVGIKNYCVNIKKNLLNPALFAINNLQVNLI